MDLPSNPEVSTLVQTAIANSLGQPELAREVQAPAYTPHPVWSPFFTIEMPVEADTSRPNMTPRQILERKQAERDYKHVDEYEWKRWLDSLGQEAYNRLTPFGRMAVNFVNFAKDFELPGVLAGAPLPFGRWIKSSFEFVPKLAEAVYREAVFGEPMNVADIIPEDMLNIMHQTFGGDLWDSMRNEDPSKAVDRWKETQRDNQWASDIALSAVGTLGAVAAGAAVSQIPGLGDLARMGGQAYLTAQMISDRVDTQLQNFNSALQAASENQQALLNSALSEFANSIRNINVTTTTPDVVVNVGEDASETTDPALINVINEASRINDALIKTITAAGLVGSKFVQPEINVIQRPTGMAGAGSTIDNAPVQCPIGTHWSAVEKRCVPNRTPDDGIRPAEKKGPSPTGAYGDVTQNTGG